MSYKKLLITGFVCVILLLLPINLMSQYTQDNSSPQEDSKPGMPRTVLEVTAGVIGSTVGLVGCGGGTFLLLLGTMEPESIGELIGESVVYLLLAGVVGLGGSILGSATGVYIVGNLGDMQGSFLASLLGSTLGTALGIIPVAMLGKDSPDVLKTATLMLSQSIGATILFNLTAKRESYRYGALLNFDSKGFKVVVPMIHLSPDTTQKHLTYGASFEILRYKF